MGEVGAPRLVLKPGVAERGIEFLSGALVCPYFIKLPVPNPKPIPKVHVFHSKPFGRQIYISLLMVSHRVPPAENAGR